MWQTLMGEVLSFQPSAFSLESSAASMRLASVVLRLMADG
jgi:hypothetical protein